MATLGTGGKKESTEWDDILKSKGIIPEKTPDEVAEEQLKEVVKETVEAYDPYEGKDVSALEEDMEEADSDEERILESYRKKRIEEMRSEAMKTKYGPGVRFVSADVWKAEVTDAGEDVYVVVHLVRTRKPYLKKFLYSFSDNYLSFLFSPWHFSFNTPLRLVS